MEEFRLEFRLLSLVSFHKLSVKHCATYILYQYISSFRGSIYHVIFSPACWIARVSFLDVKYDTFGNVDEGTWQKHLVKYSQYKIIHPYTQVCPRHHCIRKKPLRWKSINTYTGIHPHPPTHTHTHIHKHAHTRVECVWQPERRSRLLLQLILQTVFA